MTSIGDNNKTMKNAIEMGKDGIDVSKVTHAATADISDVLNPKGPRVMPLPGFEDQFVDIVDYILRITYWIWHEQKVDLCLDYYSSASSLHTMVGDIVGNQTVVDNTWATLRSFPDRTLDGENVVWDVVEPGTTYFTSHLIVSHMTNNGDSEFGPATNKRARIRTIADCIIRENVIVEEWLMRDNALLVMALGFDVKEVAKQQAQRDITENNFDLLEFVGKLRNVVQENKISSPQTSLYDANENISFIPEQDPKRFATMLFGTLWQQREWEKNISSFYDFRVTAHLPAGRELSGTMEYKEFLTEFLTGLSEVAISIDNVSTIPYLGDAVDVAVRWSLSAVHNGDSAVLGPASNTPIYLLASSHFRIIRNRVREEWTVFDELALQRQVAHQHLKANN